MAYDYSQTRNTKKTPQSEAIPGREQDMAENNAGGYTFVIDKWTRLQRFLILGSEGGTYYVNKEDHTKQNVDNSIACIKEDPKRVLDLIVEISTEGRAPKNDQAIFMLALLLTEGSNDVKKDVVAKFPEVCRIGTHLFTFVHYIDTMRSWGRTIRDAVANWYSMDPGKLEYQLIKYKGRTVEGTKNQWTHRDVLRSAHVKPKTELHNMLFKYAVKGEASNELKLIKAYEELHSDESESAENVNKLIKEYKIPHDAWPTNLKNSISTWRQALPDLPFTALMRNLNKLTALGILKEGAFDELELVTNKLTDAEYIKKSRVHPINMLIAMKTYNQGHGYKGDLSWVPVQKITDALEAGFYLSFKNVEPTGKKMLLGIDVSGSMSWSSSAIGILTAAEVAACMAMVTAKTESKYAVMGFAHEFRNLNITPNLSLNEVLRITSMHNFGGTDCALPMLWAKQQNLDFDVFVIYTDSETWYGDVHPTQALQSYRKRKHSVEEAKLIVVGVEATNFSIADPNDAGMLDICGFDSATPQIISEFSKGKI